MKTSNKVETTQPKQEKTSESAQTVDPILEARRKKFEQKEITVKEGIIRLKPTKDEDLTKMDENAMTATDEVKDLIDEIDEDALLCDDTLLLDNKTDSILFSDDESNSDNEGRFKSKFENKDKIAMLSFRKLTNGTKSDVKNDLNFNKNGKRANKKTSRSPSRSKNSSPRQQKITTPPAKKMKHSSVALSIDNKKIEIKLRNPAKYKKPKVEMEVRKTVEKLLKFPVISPWKTIQMILAKISMNLPKASLFLILKFTYDLFCFYYRRFKSTTEQKTCRKAKASYNRKWNTVKIASKCFTRSRSEEREKN